MTYLPYPKEEKIVTGCKVSWLYYKTREEAEEAAKAAEHNAVLYMQRGYDFGYCSPGSIDETDDNLFKVCIP